MPDTRQTSDVRADIEQPIPGGAANTVYGSDVVADTLRALGIPFIALTPGASFRGLHDSLVNHLGNRQPQMLLCLHEEAAVALAHGWAKVTGKPLAVALHSNVGLFHATMAIFNAWCDRVPMLIIGATGPVDALQRRPWIDWIHTARDQGAIVRHYVKWDDQPASVGAAREALVRAAWLSATAPMAPVYVNLDAAMQEAVLTEPLPPLDVVRFAPAIIAAAPPAAVAQAVTMLSEAKRPVLLIGRVAGDMGAWDARVALAEILDARVVTDLKRSAAFPTDHPLHAGPPATFPGPNATKVVADADVILSLDWVDLAGTLRAAGNALSPAARIIQVSLDHHLHNGWSMDHQALPPVDLFLSADPDITVQGLLRALRQNDAPPAPHAPTPTQLAASTSGPLSVPQMGAILRSIVAERAVSLLHLPISWDAGVWPFRHPLDFIGSDGGAGIGAGPGIAVGAALALRGSGRLCIAICGDGDFLMGVTAIWTAVHYRIPLLIVVANNRSFYNDEVHQERMARLRGRPEENKWIGQHIGDPDIDMAQLARAQGAKGFGPVADCKSLPAVLRQAIADVDAGAVAVVDVRVIPGYTPAMATALTASGSA